MNAVRTCKIKLELTKEQLLLLKETVKQHTSSYNRICKIAYENKQTNQVAIHHLTYKQERQLTKLPSQLVISAIGRSTDSLKTLRSLKKKGNKTSCPESKRCPIRYDARSSNIKLEKGYATLASINGRQTVKFVLNKYAHRYLDWKTGSSDLCEDKKGNLWLHISISKDFPESKKSNDFIGIDLGINHPAVTSNNQFLGNKHWKVVEHRIFNFRRKLQAKGSKSAKRHLKKIAEKLGRFRKDCDHVLSKQIIKSCEANSTIILENLTDIRTRVKARKQQRRRLHSWSFSRLQQFLLYKGLEKSINIEYVDPRYTSQKCSRCGTIDKKSRKTQAHFQCTSCNFTLNADLNAARNILNNHISSAKSRTNGLSVNQPIVAICKD
jgi:IS605 OrfB family transposase